MQYFMFNKLKLYLVLLLLLVSSMITSAQPNVVKMEYYVDTDPGSGLRVDIPISSATTIDLTVNVPTGSLSEGFHVLTILAQDANLVWSQYENKVFYVSQSSTLIANDINKIEYFVDADPGQGGGTDVPITAGATLSILENAPTSALSEGFHLLTVRAQDANGQWSLAESKIFFVNQSVTLEQNDISKIEYFIDADPGHGAGVDVPISAAMSLDFLENIPTASLSEGFHLLTIRAQDENGQWSLSESKVFFVNQSSTLLQNDISKIEYFIDADPGHGAGVDVPISAAISLDILENVPTASLSEGFHLLTIRAQDENGQWSLSESKVFFVNQSVTIEQNEISKIEYFIDTDPGHGAGVDVPVTAAMSLDFLENVSTASLNEGFHLLTIRAQDSNGQWSLSENKSFFVDRARQIIAYEYALDTDPGAGLATVQAIAPQDAIDVTFNIPTGSEDLGPHNLILRVQDENEFWSKTEVVPFTLCDGAVSDFSVTTTACVGDPVNFTDLSTMTQAGDVYSWDFDGDGLEDDNTSGDVSFSYLSTGTYSVTMTVDRLGCISSVTKTITITDVGCNGVPVISYIFYLNENSPNGQLVGAVTAIDPEGDPLIYSIISGNINNAFTIDGSSGNITVNSSEELDFETTPVFNLVVEANDGQGGVSMVSITINLNDIDEDVLGIDGPDNQIMVYPNPAQEVLFIELNKNIIGDLDIQLYSLSGSLVLEEIGTRAGANQTMVLDISKAKSGIYILKIRSKFETVTRNILIR